MIPDENQTTVYCVFVKFVGGEEAFVLDLCEFLIEFLFGLVFKVKFHVFNEVFIYYSIGNKVITLV